MSKSRSGRDEAPVSRPRSRRPLRALVVAVLGAAVLAAVAGGIAWQATGGRWQVISTPSMGQAAPVGSLVLTRPVTADRLAVGDVVTYRPPNPAYRETITHRVIAVERSDGGTGVVTGVRTQGDVNGASDPWVVRTPDLVGQVVVIGWGLGWLVKALPLLVTGGLLVWWATRLWAPLLWRIPLRVLGFSLLLSTATYLLKPFVGVVSLGSSADAAGTHIAVVSTGMLPVRVAAQTGGSVDLVDGQVGVITTLLPPNGRGATLVTGLHMPVWLWAVMVALWLLPLAYGLVAGYRRLDEIVPDDPADEDRAGGPGGPGDTPATRRWTPADLVPAGGPGRRVLVPLTVRTTARPRRRPRLAGAALVTVTVAGLVLTTAGTTAAFTARVTNSADTAATNPYFTCLAAATAPATAAPSFVWPLDDASVANNATARDVEGNNRTGTYINAFTSTTNKPCPRDTPARAVTLAPTATAQSYVATTATTATAGVNVFTMSIWFNTTTTGGGKLMGFGSSRTGQSGSYDRHLYMTNAGAVVFGVYPNTVRTISSATGYNDGQWHQAVATLSSAGMVLYLDGQAVATDTTTTTAQVYNGWWRVGWDNLNGWTNRPTTDYWPGSLSYAAVYSGVALTAGQVAQSEAAG